MNSKNECKLCLMSHRFTDAGRFFRLPYLQETVPLDIGRISNTLLAGSGLSASKELLLAETPTAEQIA